MTIGRRIASVRGFRMLTQEQLGAHPFRNLRNSWQTNARWSLRLPPWMVEPMMGHSAQGVTGIYYDRPQADVVAEVIAEAYAQRPYDDGWN